MWRETAVSRPTVTHMTYQYFCRERRNSYWKFLPLPDCLFKVLKNLKRVWHPPHPPNPRPPALIVLALEQVLAGRVCWKGQEGTEEWSYQEGSRVGVGVGASPLLSLLIHSLLLSLLLLFLSLILNLKASSQANIFILLEMRMKIGKASWIGKGIIWGKHYWASWLREQKMQNFCQLNYLTWKQVRRL